MGKRLTQEEFLRRAKEVHGDRYEYSMVVYRGLNHNVDIICSEHGVFPQRPRAHVDQKQNCPKCKIITTDVWIERAKELWGGRYDYSKVDYKGWDIPIIIICRTHGEFEMIPHAHISKQCGCSKCVKYTTEEWIEKARLVHGDRYDYSITEYVDAAEKVRILCNDHGEFEQIPSSHTNGCGCPSCVEHGFKPYLPAAFYIYAFPDSYGFGITNDFIGRNSRHRGTFSKFSVDAKLVGLYNGQGYLVQSVESEVKKNFRIYNTGMPGFVTEAVHVDEYEKLTSLLDATLEKSNETF